MDVLFFILCIEFIKRLSFFANPWKCLSAEDFVCLDSYIKSTVALCSGIVEHANEWLLFPYKPGSDPVR